MYNTEYYIIERHGKRTDGTSYVDRVELSHEETDLLLSIVRQRWQEKKYQRPLIEQVEPNHPILQLLVKIDV